MTKSVEDMIGVYLKEHGYDGLLNTDRDCSCSVNELFPCGNCSPWCVAGVRITGSDYEDNLQVAIDCVQCGKPVEEERRCYAIPTCFACLPPPEPLPVCPVAERFKP